MLGLSLLVTGMFILTATFSHCLETFVKGGRRLADAASHYGEIDLTSMLQFLDECDN
jgi:hypothetical protein